MPEIHTLLRDYGEHLEEIAPAISVEEIERAPLRPTAPLLWWQRPAWVVALAAVVVLLAIGGLGLLIGGGPDDDAVAPSTNPESTVPGSTIVETTPPTVSEAAPTTIPVPEPPPLPPLGDEVALDETQRFLAGVVLEVAGQLGMTDYSISFGNGPDDTPPTSVSIEETSVHAFPSADDASRYLASKEAEERADELEQPEPPDLGDEAVAFHGTGWTGSQVVFLVRIESHVVEVSLFEPEQLSPPEELAVFVAALESPTSPGFSAYGEPLADPLESGADEIGVRYAFGSWRLPVGDVGGEPAEITFGWDHSGDSPQSCTYWWGDVEPHVLVTYTEVGDGTVNVHVDDWFEGTQEDFVVGEDDPDYMAASEGCDRYPNSAEAWGIDETSYSVETVVDSEFRVYPTGDNDFVLLAGLNYDIITDGITPDQLALIDIPPGVTVTEFDVGVGWSGEMTVLLELEGLRSDLESMFGIDLSAMPNERIGLSFGLD